MQEAYKNKKKRSLKVKLILHSIVEVRISWVLLLHQLCKHQLFRQYSTIVTVYFSTRFFSLDSNQKTIRKLKNGRLKQSLSTTSNMNRHLLRKKSHQKFSVMRTKNTGVSKNIVCFGILIHGLFWRQKKHQCLYFPYWDFLTNFWRSNWQSIFDVVERLC